MKKYALILLLLQVSYSNLYGQKKTTFYLMPNAGIEWPISNFKDNSQTPPPETGIYISTTDKYGIALLVDFNSKWNIELGYGHGNVGRGVKFNSFRAFGSSSANRSYLSISKPIKLIEIRKKKHVTLDNLLKIDKSYGYWFIFDINILGGFSYGFIPPGIIINGLNLNGNKADVSVLEIERYGMGIYTGIYFQFYRNNKKRLRLGFIYQQGLRDRMLLNWETSIKGIKQPEFQTFTRDSMLAIYVAYPIKLFSIKEKGTIKGL